MMKIFDSLPSHSADLDLNAVLLEAGARFALDWEGIHGFPHWRRVHREGVRVARIRGANLKVVELFSILHDCCRENDFHDPKHGPRAADFARSLAGSVFTISTKELDQLCDAIRNHSRGLMSSDSTIQSCWDADRLDLRRIGVVPDPALLSVEAYGLLTAVSPVDTLSG